HWHSSSSVFNDMFSLPQSDGADGESDDKPILLDGVEAVDFERFLNVLYPLYVTLAQSETLFDEWISILHLATMWRFADIRQLAIQNLTNYVSALPSLRKISLGSQYSVQSWFLEGCIEGGKPRKSERCRIICIT
ncbi:hypothetical protein BDV98DRAFT_500720, partial [Pterulicium gracile]